MYDEMIKQTVIMVIKGVSPISTLTVSTGTDFNSKCAQFYCFY